jgi:hypothetical protein
MTTHLIADPTTTGTAVFPAAPGWLSLSAAMTAEVPAIADRDDLLVTIAPGAGHGHPACLLHDGLIEIDGTHLGTVDPATATPHLISDRARYATVWGLLTHECAHAHHSRWTPPDDADPDAFAAADLLEEPRIEAAQIRRRPADRHWLRASATNLVLNDTKADDPAGSPKMTSHDAARIAALLLGRTDGGILTCTETAPVARAVRAVLGTEKLRKLRALWREAFTVADNDADAMLDLGRRWCEIVGPESTDDGDPEPDDADQPSASPGTTASSPLARAVNAALRNVASAVASTPPPEDPTATAAKTKAAAEATARRSADAARAVFNASESTQGGDEDDGDTATAGTRPPTTAERTAARVLARALSTAGVRDRVATKTTSAVPPGRLRMRGVLAREAQRAAGATPTAEPFTRVIRTAVSTPPLRLGIACDVSGSMWPVTKAVASTAWILANAARHTLVPTDTATVIFGNHVRPITYPGTAPSVITEFPAEDAWENIPTAIDALDGALGLSHPNAARLLVIISDGEYRADPRYEGQKRINRLRASGCAVLWLSTGDNDTPLDGVTVHRLDVHATHNISHTNGDVTAWCPCDWEQRCATRTEADTAAVQHLAATDPGAVAHAVGRAATAALRTAH